MGKRNEPPTQRLKQYARLYPCQKGDQRLLSLSSSPLKKSEMEKEVFASAYKPFLD